MTADHIPAAQRPRKCRCKSCRFVESVERQKKKLSKHGRIVIERLLNKWAMAETDAAFYKAKLEGTWPE